MDKDSGNSDSFSLSDDERRKAEEFQKAKRKELSKISPVALLARLRSLLSDVTTEQAERDRTFLESDNTTDTTRDNEKD